jgi:hypothetical protein
MLAVKQMTRCVVRHRPLRSVNGVLYFDSFQLLTDVPHAGAESARLFGKRFILAKQVCVGNQHRATTAGVRDYGSALIRLTRTERCDVSARERARPFEIAGVRM